MGLVSLIGRLLVVPVALSGVCLSMLFGVPMAGAMEMDQSMMSAHQELPSDGCGAVRMEHDIEATTPDQGKTPVAAFIAGMSSEAVAQKSDYLESTWILSSHFPSHQPFSLIGIIFKRE